MNKKQTNKQKNPLKQPGKVEARDFRAELAKPNEKSLLKLTIFLPDRVGRPKSRG